MLWLEIMYLLGDEVHKFSSLKLFGIIGLLYVDVRHHHLKI